MYIMTRNKLPGHFTEVEPFIGRIFDCPVVQIESIDVYVGFHEASLQSNEKGCRKAVFGPASEVTGEVPDVFHRVCYEKSMVLARATLAAP